MILQDGGTESESVAVGVKPKGRQKKKEEGRAGWDGTGGVTSTVSYVNKQTVLVSLFLWRVWCVKFEKDDVSIFNDVVSSLLSVFPCCL